MEIVRSSDGGWRSCTLLGRWDYYCSEPPFPAGCLELGATGASSSQDLRLSRRGVGTEDKGERSGGGEPRLGVEWKDCWEASRFRQARKCRGETRGESYVTSGGRSSPPGSFQLPESRSLPWPPHLSNLFFNLSFPPSSPPSGIWISTGAIKELLDNIKRWRWEELGGRGVLKASLQPHSASQALRSQLGVLADSPRPD